MKTPLRPDGRFSLIVAVLALFYAALYIMRTSIVLDGVRYFTLFDDAMISMRYARNLIAGAGMVMNPGERVEGVTNPVWVFFMAVVHLLPIATERISLVIQATGAALLAANLWVTLRIARALKPDSPAVSGAAVFLTAFYLPLVSWTLQGMEVGLVTLIISLAVLEGIGCITSGRSTGRLFLLLGFGTLVRIDLAVPFLAVLLFLAVVRTKDRRRVLATGLTCFIGFLGGQTLARYLYYGDVLPNTYYLKMTGYPVLLRISRGAIVFWDFVKGMTPVVFILPLGALFRGGSRERWFVAWIVAAQCAYSIYVGGDAWEAWGGSNRYLSAVMPLFFVLATQGIAAVVAVAAGWLSGRKGKNPVLAGARFGVFFMLVVAAFLLVNNNHQPLSLNGMLFRRRPMLWEGNRQMIQFAKAVRAISTPDARIAVTWAGAIPYFSERPTIDILGKTDRVIAREPMHQGSGKERFSFFYPGHLKYDYRHSLGELEPDIILQLWSDQDQATPYVAARYVRIAVDRWAIFVRGESPRIRWDVMRANAMPQDSPGQ